MIQEAYDELDGSRIDPAEELKFTQRLKKYPDEYKGQVRTGILAKLLDKDKGDLVYWYETSREVYVKSKQCWRMKKGYSVKPENLNLDEYKNLLLNKLEDSLVIAGFDTAFALTLQGLDTVPLSVRYLPQVVYLRCFTTNAKNGGGLSMLMAHMC